MKILKKRSNLRNLISLHQYLNDEYYDSDGNAVIDIRLYEGLELYNPLSMGKQRELNPEIIEYIDERSVIIPATVSMIIRFHCPSLSVSDQDMVRNCITEHYTVVMHEKARDKRINRNKMLLLAGLGITILAAYLALALHNEESMRTEILSIIASFSLWEATDLFLLERNSIKKEIWEASRHIAQRIEFIED